MTGRGKREKERREEKWKEQQRGGAEVKRCTGKGLGERGERTGIGEEGRDGREKWGYMYRAGGENWLRSKR